MLAARILPVVLTVLLVPCAGAAATPLHQLDAVECIEEAPIDRGCAKQHVSFGGDPGVGDVVVSPDGNDVYLTAGSGTITHFKRSPSGSLEWKGCVSDPAPSEPEVLCMPNTPGLEGAWGLAISPDGADLYAVSWMGTISHARRAADGSLSAGSGCVEDAGAAQGCATALNGLGGAIDVVVSPDGGSVYVAGENDDTIVHLRRGAGGALTAAGCVKDFGAAPGCATSVSGLDGIAGLAIAPDGGELFSVAIGDDTTTRFGRAADGSLSQRQCIAVFGSSNCIESAVEMDGPRSLAVSPDGHSVYVGVAAGAVLAYRRTAETLRLAPVGCTENSGAAVGCLAFTLGLQSPADMVVAPDAGSLLVRGLNTVASLGRTADGQLAPMGAAGCFVDSSGPSGCQPTEGIGSFGNLGYNRIAISPDGASVYATGTSDRAIAVFRREVAPRCTASGSRGEVGATQTVALRCVDANGEPVSIAIVRQPQHGSLGPVAQAARTVAYTPAPGFAGIDSFEFTAKAGEQTSAPAVAFVAVESPALSGSAGGDGGEAAAAGGATERQRLIALLVGDRLSGKAGKRVKLSLVSTAPGAVSLKIKRGKKLAKALRGRVGANGTASLTWVAKAKGKPASAGPYKLELTVTGADGQVARDGAKLTLRN